MQRLCSNELEEKYHNKCCDNDCIRYKDCVSRLTGCDFSLNLDTMFIDHSDTSWTKVLTEPRYYTNLRLS